MLIRCVAYVFLWIKAYSKCLRKLDIIETAFSNVDSSVSLPLQLQFLSVGHFNNIFHNSTLLSSLILCFSCPHSSDQSLMVVEAVLSQVRQTLLSQSRMKRSWVLMMMSRRTPMTTAGVGPLSPPLSRYHLCIFESNKILLIFIIESKYFCNNALMNLVEI